MALNSLNDFGCLLRCRIDINYLPSKGFFLAFISRAVTAREREKDGKVGETEVKTAKGHSPDLNLGSSVNCMQVDQLGAHTETTVTAGATHMIQSDNQ